MDTTATMRGGRWLVTLALVALVGCDASGEMSGFANTGGSGDQRGDVDANGAGGAAATSAGGAMGSAGGVAGANAAGGRSGAGGAISSAGGAQGSMGGAAGAGAGGAPANYLPCDVYSWTPSDGGGCTKQVTAGVFLTGYKDGHKCGVCSAPARAAGVPECTWESTSVVCVLSCDECTFQ